ncbi:Kynureninase [Jatrophihabitans endophyticus]|uniref:Kynureninase n=1 Tax=Jatrophihabitans endophyticus TaxID=1206085 RepID=A0A1M5U4P5_9ACTN|nr:kynureninase [Jatrophihabitans endophyticus]SHH57841.1 Kynureninase [Jatrophihabitans endophyticus]
MAEPGRGVPRVDSRDAALAADEADPIAFVRARFAVPEDITYLDGNSLGALPVGVRDAVADTVERQWGRDLVRSWNANGWWTLPARVGDRIGALVGAAPGQVMCGDSTSVQLFQAITALARLVPHRRTIVTDGGNFPTDQYVAESVARLLGVRLLRVAPPDLDAVLAREGGDVAVVALSAVDYRTGELWDAAGITRAVHAAGGLVLWDLAHAAGAVPFDLDGIGADAAVGCSYKYLNGGPGAPAWIYLPARHQAAAELPLTGWQGHAAPFALERAYAPAAGIERARIGTPAVLAMRSLDAALDVFDDVTIDDVRAKSLALTGLVIDYADAFLPGVGVATPRDPARRGSQVALALPDAYAVTQALIERGVIGDFREPDLLRLGFAAPYLSYAQVWDALDTLRAVLAGGEYRDPRFATRAQVT